MEATYERATASKDALFFRLFPHVVMTGPFRHSLLFVWDHSPPLTSLRSFSTFHSRISQANWCNDDFPARREHSQPGRIHVLPFPLGPKPDLFGSPSRDRKPLLFQESRCGLMQIELFGFRLRDISDPVSPFRRVYPFQPAAFCYLRGSRSSVSLFLLEDMVDWTQEREPFQSPLSIGVTFSYVLPDPTGPASSLRPFPGSQLFRLPPVDAISLVFSLCVSMEITTTSAVSPD